ncbi:MAG: B12-binding domain-containing radical SAM protein [Thermoanaerobaculales bacterium]|nr:B12-binding domain-containing radical SAM protein [Thermoanaerobaculales bacterium]
MKIKLIAPHEQREDSLSSPFKLQRVNLPLLAALTPPGHTITIVEEAFAPDDIHQDVDLVGITVLTELAPRAYRIADAYRQKAVKVVMGGIHPTVLPDEALEHADAVVVGEAEGVWPRLVSDAASGRMQRIYRAGKLTDLQGLPTPRRDLVSGTRYQGVTRIPISVETSRGCPYDCEFCSIGQTLGQQYRVRPVQEVIAEIESIDSPHLFFVDDALGLNRDAAKKLFTEMIPLRRRWLAQGTVSLAQDLELLGLMRRSGCLGLLIGFESVQKATQNEVMKITNLRIDFYEAMRRFHGEGFGILGSFVFGFDYENKDVFDQTLEFIMRCHMDVVQLRVLTPYPGTRLYKRLLCEDRLFVRDWWLRGYPPDTLLFQPKGMTADELISGYARLNRQAYSLGAMMKRFLGMSPWKRTLLGCQAYVEVNLSTRKRYFKELRNPQSFLRGLRTQ